MKKLLLVLIALVSFTANAYQGYEPIVKEGRQWVYRLNYKSQITGKLSKLPMVFEFKGDTIIKGNTYKKCYRTFMGNDIAQGSIYGDYTITDAPMLVACCREYSINYNEATYVTAIFSQEYKNEMIGYDYGTVPLNEYQLLSDNTYESIVYCLNAKDESDIYEFIEKTYGVFGQPLYYFYFGSAFNMRLTDFEKKVFNFTAIDSVRVGGEQRMKIHGKLGEWIESIGYTGQIMASGRASNFLSIAAKFRYLDHDNTYSLLSHVVENGNIIYKAGGYDPTVDFTSSSGTSDVLVTTLPSDDSYYNLQGQRVSEPAAGIYIHNGKKVIVK